MGSRAVVLACRDADVAAKRFGVQDGSTGAIYTRTGRPFFDPETTEALLARLREAMTGVCDLLSTDWLLLDCELLPWSAKALGLIQQQYASVGAAAGAALPAALDVLDATAARGVDGDLTSLRTRIAERAENAERFVSAYRRYVAPTDGLAGITLAPFAVLAGEGASYAGRDHGWHLDFADRLLAADPPLFTKTERRVVDLDDGATVAEATRWWSELTEAGGEGMVLKPLGGLAVTSRGRLVQPGVKCRGREYLRIIYGPDYLGQLDDLRRRSVGRKRALASQEHQLGLSALDRLAESAALWRIHQLVLAILAAESQPVDPRL
jgi:hypothetical protein